MSPAHRAASHDPSAPALDLVDVTVTYGNVVALDHITLRLNRGDQVAVVGPNGAGKSTLFHVIAGVLRPDTGTVRVYGSGPDGHICVGYVPQRARTDSNFPVTVFDVVMMGRAGRIGLLRRPGRADRVAVRAALAQVELLDLAQRPIGALSGGQQQRVLLARALAQEAEILLLDEPLTGLDLPSQEALLATLNVLREQGITLLVATHDLNQAATRFPLVALVNRRLVGFGPPAQVLTAVNLAGAFGSNVHVVHTDDGDLLVTDTCCDDTHPLPDAVIGRSADAVALPGYEVEVDGSRNMSRTRGRA
jgi:manganese/iron transport system ATP-binding protein